MQTQMIWAAMMIGHSRTKAAPSIANRQCVRAVGVKGAAAMTAIGSQSQMKRALNIPQSKPPSAKCFFGGGKMRAFCKSAGNFL